MNESVLFVFAAVIIIGGLLLALMGLGRKGSRHLDQAKYRSRWLDIEQKLSRDNESSYTVCVMEADKLLDHALQEKGLKGRGMADRLKAVSTQLTYREPVWQAHKLRNRLAHEAGAKVSYDDARRALGALKQALKDVGAI